MADVVAIRVIINKPIGETETLAVDPAAELQAGPGFIFEFPDLDSSHRSGSERADQATRI